ncbi:MAG: precorrin-6y C5,15-methyltransferase (decarboxylating) subunit CbiE [Coriobacteriia bacterium]|nr:precorrin-6y C5,15-methyltransferase (decarboxylating) subunit CbiE [Coriobacteriia bacterium]
MNKLYIIGFGPGEENQVTECAEQALSVSERLLCLKRSAGFGDDLRRWNLPELLEELKANTAPATTALLVSGDCGFYSIAKTVVRDYSQLYDIELIPGISSIQYFSARLKVAYDDAKIVSLHGRSGNIVAQVAYQKKLFALTGGQNSVRHICQELFKHGLGNVLVSVGERLSYAQERITKGSAAELSAHDFDELSVVYIENPKAKDPYLPLKDSDFLRNDVPMTKEEVRWVSLAKLGVCPGDTVYDIGAGTGSVSVELARAASEGCVYAIESKAEACALAQANLKRHGAFNLRVIKGLAPEALADLPAPDKAFIGGSSGRFDQIVETVLEKNPAARIVANAVTLQTLHEAMECFAKNCMTEIEAVCLNVARSKKAGGYDMMVAQNPVYIISALGCGADFPPPPDDEA